MRQGHVLRARLNMREGEVVSWASVSLHPRNRPHHAKHSLTRWLQQGSRERMLETGLRSLCLSMFSRHGGQSGEQQTWLQIPPPLPSRCRFVVSALTAPSRTTVPHAHAW